MHAMTLEIYIILDQCDEQASVGRPPASYTDDLTPSAGYNDKGWDDCLLKLISYSFEDYSCRQ